MPELVVTVEKDGKTRIEVNGEQGAVCTDMTKTLAANMRLAVLTEELKPEFYEAVIENTERQRG